MLVQKRQMEHVLCHLEDEDMAHCLTMSGSERMVRNIEFVKFPGDAVDKKRILNC